MVIEEGISLTPIADSQRDRSEECDGQKSMQTVLIPLLPSDHDAASNSFSDSISLQDSSGRKCWRRPRTLSSDSLGRCAKTSDLAFFGIRHQRKVFRRSGLRNESAKLRGQSSQYGSSEVRLSVSNLSTSSVEL